MGRLFLSGSGHQRSRAVTDKIFSFTGETAPDNSNQTIPVAVGEVTTAGRIRPAARGITHCSLASASGACDIWRLRFAGVGQARDMPKNTLTICAEFHILPIPCRGSQVQDLRS